jgi:putative sigma-54 modulation protein
MIIQIRAKDVSLTQNAREHIESALEVFQKFGLELTSVNCNVRSEKKGVNIEFDIHIAHAQPVVINQSDDDLSTAIDLAVERASKALRRLHTKLTEHGATSLRDLETLDA